MEKGDESRALLLAGMDYLVSISFVPDDEVFKITLDYWNFLVPDVYSSVCTINNPPLREGLMFGEQSPMDRKSLYSGVLSNLRRLMIARMARPEEVGGCGCVGVGVLCLACAWRVLVTGMCAEYGVSLFFTTSVCVSMCTTSVCETLLCIPTTGAQSVLVSALFICR